MDPGIGLEYCANPKFLVRVKVEDRVRVRVSQGQS